MSYRYFDERMETLPSDTMRTVQDHRLRWQFRRCWDGSAWYRARFETAGLAPETFAGLSDLSRLPLLTASDLQGVDRAVRRVAPKADTWVTFGQAAWVDEQHERARRDRAFWAQKIHLSTPRPMLTAPRDAGRRARHVAECLAWRDGDVRTYALTLPDVGGLLAYECIHRLGRHWVDDHFLAEILDPRTGAALPDGSVGELVVTDLVRDAYPLIRFQTGLRRALTRETCPCGRTCSRVWTARQLRAARQRTSQTV